MSIEEPLPSSLDQPDDSGRRGGKARERQRQRLEKRKRSGQETAPPVVVTTPRNATIPPRKSRRSTAVRPAGTLKMPEVKLPAASRLPFFVVAGVMVVIVGVFLLGQLRNREPEPSPNAIWLGTDWTYSRPDEAELQALVNQLREHHIGTVYALVSYLQPDGTWAGDPQRQNQFEQVRGAVEAFVVDFRRLYPEAQILGWIALPFGTDGARYGLETEALYQRVTAFAQTTVSQVGFDGIFFQADNVASGDETFRIMLRRLRDMFGENVPVAVAVPPDWTPQAVGVPQAANYAPGTVWAEEYKQRIALIADQIVVMAFNSGLTSPDDYAEWVAYQVETFAGAVASVDGGAQIIIAVSTLGASPVHDLNGESITAAGRGIDRGVERLGSAASFIEGIGLFTEWETSPEEWNDFAIYDSR